MEEDSDVVYYVVERSGGQIETVSVDVTTQPGSAVSPGELTYVPQTSLSHQ